MKLYLAQHGHAVDKTVDPDRPLSAQGREDVSRIAGLLKTAGIRPGNICHSGKTRAHQSAEIFADTLSCGTISILPGLAPNDPLVGVQDFIDQQEIDVMLVGHLPFMQRLTSALLNNNETTGYRFLPGSVACLEREEKQWSMNWMVRPDLMNI